MSEDQLRKTILKRARAKFVSYGLNSRIISEIPPEAPGWIRSFNHALECNSVIKADHENLRSSYCRCRTCIVCSRIRAGIYIRDYVPKLSDLDDPRLLTLTIRNVEKENLTASIREMAGAFREIKEHLRYKKIPARGIRKLEVTYNEKENNYHPHYHAIIEKEITAEIIRERWVSKHFSGRAEIYLQDQKPIRDINTAAKEIFKYFSKLIKKNKLTGEISFHPAAMFEIVKALRRVRVFQPLGIQKAPEPPDEILLGIHDDELKNDLYLWDQIRSDWLSQKTGRGLSGYVPTPKIKKLCS